MTRVSTAGNYQSALLNLMKAQTAQNDAQSRVSSQKVATDMAGFGRGAESLTTLKSAQARIQGFIDIGEAVNARLGTQDLALTQMGDAIDSARESIGGALASGSTNNLMLELEGQFQSIQNGLNSEHQGAYLFGGANSTKAPVAVGTLAELAAAPSTASVFGNDTIAPVSRLGEGSSIQTGFLANDLGQAIFDVMRDIKAYNDDPATGPLTGKPTDAQQAFLSAQLQRIDFARVSVTEATARNGSLQKSVESRNASHAAQVEALDGLVSKKTDADLAQAVSDLQLSQIAVQASAQVISQLSQVSLLQYLR